MTNAELLAKIKAEIERRYKEFDGKTGDIATASRLAYLDVLSFLSTLEESERPEPYNPVYDEAYLNEKIKKATESWKGVDVDAMLAECRGYDEEKSEKPMNQDGLEKEYEDYVVKDPCFSKLVNRNAGLVVARHFFDLGCRRTAEKYDEIEYNRQRAEEHLATSGKTISVKPGDEVAINGHKIVYYKDKGYVTIVKSE